MSPVFKMSLSPMHSEIERVDMACGDILDDGETCGPAPRVPAAIAHASVSYDMPSFPSLPGFPGNISKFLHSTQSYE